MVVVILGSNAIRELDELGIRTGGVQGFEDGFIPEACAASAHELEVGVERWTSGVEVDKADAHVLEFLVDLEPGDCRYDELLEGANEVQVCDSGEFAEERKARVELFVSTAGFHD